MKNELEEYLEKIAPDGICLAYSGGTDSSLLLAVLAKMNAKKPFPFKAVIFSSCFQAKRETEEALAFAESLGVRPQIVHFDALGVKGIRYNPKNRCYLCKNRLFSRVRKIADKEGLKYLADGTNADDANEWRPGRAALEEHGVVSPFADLGMTKKMIRDRSEKMGLPTARKPSNSCLATRFAYGQELTETGLKNTDKGEEFLKSMGFSVVRLRRHGEIARIEILPEEMDKFIARREEIVSGLKETGCVWLTLDLEGFRSGSMDV